MGQRIHLRSLPGTANSQSIPWVVKADTSVLMLVSTSVGEAGTLVSQKEMTTLADLLCSITRSRGVTEARVVDHALVPKTQAMYCCRKLSRLRNMLN